jgi:hypothetical protein
MNRDAEIVRLAGMPSMRVAQAELTNEPPRRVDEFAWRVLFWDHVVGSQPSTVRS